MLLCTLGKLELQQTNFSRPKPLLLLCYLALEGPQERRHMAELFWPEASDHMKSLGVALAQLRRDAPEAIEANSMQLRALVNTDIKILETAIAQEDIENAKKLYKGAFLEGFYLSNCSAELEEWVYAQRERLAYLTHQAILKFAEKKASEGEHIIAVKYTELAYNLAGAPNLEVEDLERCYNLLSASDSPELHKIRKELQEYGITPTSSKKVKLISNHEQKKSSNNLPPLPPLFMGRQQELAEIQALLAQKDCRLLTVVGTGGVGKTSLILQVAKHLLEKKCFKDGLYFVSLAAINDPDLVISSIAQNLGVAENPKNPVIDSVKSFLKDKQILLVLDNFEQVTAATSILGELLQSCPKLKLLVTSRVTLHLSLEKEYPLEPLDLPDLQKLPATNNLLNYPAIALFVKNAKNTKPSFTLNEENARAIAEICCALDGLPLAIYLASARIKMLSPKALLKRLDKRLEILKGGAKDFPSRHRTLQATIDWSHSLLTETEQVLFRRLAIFVGGFNLEAAESVCQGLGIFDGVTELVNKSLIYSEEQASGEMRFFMLETIREYALNSLKEVKELETLQEAHLNYYLALAEQAEPELIGAKQIEWFTKLAEEHDNLRAAIVWAKDKGKIELGLKLAVAIWRFWMVRGHIREGSFHLKSLLNHPKAQAKTMTRVKALNGLGTLMFTIGDFDRARPVFEESLAIARDFDDELVLANTLNNLSWVSFHCGYTTKGQELSEEALEKHKNLENKRGEALSLNNLAWGDLFKGELLKAKPFFQESLKIRQEIEDKRGIILTAINLAWIENTLGNYKEGVKLLTRASETLKRFEDKLVTSWAKFIQGEGFFEQGNLAQAAENACESLKMFYKSSNQEVPALAATLLADIRREQGDLVAAETCLNEATNHWQAIDGYKWGIARTYLSQSKLAYVHKDYGLALEFINSSLNLREEIGDKLGLAQCYEALTYLKIATEELKLAIEALVKAKNLRVEIAVPLPPIEQEVYQGALKRLKIEL